MFNIGITPFEAGNEVFCLLELKKLNETELQKLKTDNLPEYNKYELVKENLFSSELYEPKSKYFKKLLLCDSKLLKAYRKYFVDDYQTTLPELVNTLKRYKVHPKSDEEGFIDYLYYYIHGKCKYFPGSKPFVPKLDKESLDDFSIKEPENLYRFIAMIKHIEDTEDLQSIVNNKLDYYRSIYANLEKESHFVGKTNFLKMIENWIKELESCFLPKQNVHQYKITPFLAHTNSEGLAKELANNFSQSDAPTIAFMLYCLGDMVLTKEQEKLYQAMKKDFGFKFSKTAIFDKFRNIEPIREQSVIQPVKNKIESILSKLK